MPGVAMYPLCPCRQPHGGKVKIPFRLSVVQHKKNRGGFKGLRHEFLGGAPLCPMQDKRQYGRIMRCIPARVFSLCTLLNA